MKVSMIAVVITVLVITLLAVRVFFNSINSLTYRIFKAESKGYYFHKLLGIVPSPYQDRYSRVVLESFDNVKVINIVDEIGSSHQNFIVLTVGAESKFLRAYPFELVGVKEKTIESSGWNKHISMLINIEVFNEYVRSKELKSRQDIIGAYCSFLSNPTNPTMHKILRSTSDIDSLIAHWPLNNLEFVKATAKLVDATSLDFDQPEGTVFCWFYNAGVVKLAFTFNEDNTVKSVDSDIIGLLGNEFPTI